MKLYELVKKGKYMLEQSGVVDSEIDADLLWQYMSGMNKMEMLLDREREVSEEEETDYLKLIEKRSERIPLQYITGMQNFMGYDFCTSKNVLIPRQDTEVLVETALKLMTQYKNSKGITDMDSVDVLDMCCGTGCIGISFGLMSSNAYVTLADISDDAIAVTGKNVLMLCEEKDRYKILHTDLFSNVQGKYDMILSNPPYIRSGVIETLMPEVRDNEPRLALDGMEDGLYFYRIIVSQARNYIKDEGYVVFEIGNDQAEDVQHLFVESGCEDIHVVKDLCGNDRVVYARYRL